MLLHLCQCSMDGDHCRKENGREGFLIFGLVEQLRRFLVCNPVSFPLLNRLGERDVEDDVHLRYQSVCMIS